MIGAHLQIAHLRQKIEVQAQHAIPSEIIFSLKDSPLRANAKVIWRQDKELGLQFIA